MCGVNVGQPSLKKIIASIYSESAISKIMNEVIVQLNHLLLLNNIIIDLIETNNAIIVGIKNQ